MNSHIISPLSMAAALLALNVGGAYAADLGDVEAIEPPASYPRIVGEVEVEIENDNTFKSDDPTIKINDLYATVGLALAFEFSPEFSLQSGMTFEPVLDPRPSKDRWFGDRSWSRKGRDNSDTVFLSGGYDWASWRNRNDLSG